MRATMQRRFLGCMLFRPTLEAVIDDTVFATPQRNPTLLRNVLLTHVMAHEIGHLLLGPANACVPQRKSRSWVNVRSANHTPETSGNKRTHGRIAGHVLPGESMEVVHEHQIATGIIDL